MRPFVASGLGALAYCTGLMSFLQSFLVGAGLTFIVDQFNWLREQIRNLINWFVGVAERGVDAVQKAVPQLGAAIKAAVNAIKGALAALGVSAASIASSIVLAVLMYVAIKLLT